MENKNGEDDIDYAAILNKVAGTVIQPKTGTTFGEWTGQIKPTPKSGSGGESTAGGDRNLELTLAEKQKARADEKRAKATGRHAPLVGFDKKP